MKPLTSEEIRQKFIEFMQSKGHKEAPNASLVPLNDPSVLFTTAGMHPLVPYLMGQPHPLGKRLVNSQKCVRTNDIDEVGDTTHLTFFEMLGYWSLGDYFKEEALNFTFEFFTSKEYMNFNPNRLYVTVFEGDENAAEDKTSIETWTKIFDSVGIRANAWNKKDFEDKNLRIFPLNKKENWWGPAGETGPCGPDSEIFYWRGEGEPDFNQYVPWDSSEMFIEIGNDVFMEFNKNDDGTFELLKEKNVDFGGGLERATMISQFKNEDGSFPITTSIYDTDLFQPIISKIEEISNNEYQPTSNDSANEETRSFRIIAEHARSATFILADNVIPKSKDQGYILRRLIRRMIRHGMTLGIEENFTKEIAAEVIKKMRKPYPHLKENERFILDEIEKEEIKFRKTLDKGVKEIRKILSNIGTSAEDEIDASVSQDLNGETAFYLYETYGFPLEMTIEEFGITDEKEIERVTNEFKKKEEKHKEQSRAGAEQKFKGGLADQSEETTKLHTTHHLLLKALQIVLGEDVKQRGSNITGERLRIDFSYGKKLTEEQVQKVEEIVNNKIEEALSVKREEMPKEEAEKIGAEMEFGQKYPDVVSVYYIGESLEDAFSKEFCGGPHVENTSEIGKGGKRFKVKRQENIGSGLRRIKGVLV